MTAELLKARVAGQFEALDWVISNIDTERFGRRPQVDKWSAHEHLAHVACSQQRFLERSLTLNSVGSDCIQPSVP